ncbi:hypothetical protein D3C73_1003520 [compost metagenome]
MKWASNKSGQAMATAITPGSFMAARREGVFWLAWSCAPGRSQKAITARSAPTPARTMNEARHVMSEPMRVPIGAPTASAMLVPLNTTAMALPTE